MAGDHDDQRPLRPRDVKPRDLAIEVAAEHARDHGEPQADGALRFVIGVYDGLDWSSPIRT
jgi:hypothetical protein